MASIKIKLYLSKLPQDLWFCDSLLKYIKIFVHDILAMDYLKETNKNRSSIYENTSFVQQEN